jgi:hypothetical protein
MQDFSAWAEGKADDGGGAGAADLISCAAANDANHSKVAAARINTSGGLRHASCTKMTTILGSLLYTSEKNS